MKVLRIGALAATLLWATTAQADVLKLAHFMPPTHPMDVQVMTPMAEAYNEAMAGVSTTLPAGIFPGQLATNGTRTPPS